MLTVLITIRRRGAPARRIVGIFATTADAIIHLMDTVGDSLAGCKVQAEALS
jgi:hypothetical protein